MRKLNWEKITSKYLFRVFRIQVIAIKEDNNLIYLLLKQEGFLSEYQIESLCYMIAVTAP